MFVEAIETAAAFTRAIHIITRYYGSTEIHPGAATLFLVNADGWALTCRHIAAHLIGAEQLTKRRTAFRADIAAMPTTGNARKHRRALERKHGFSKGGVFDIRNNFVNCVQTLKGFTLKPHPDVDIALLKFENYTRLGCSTFPTFAANATDLKQGKFLCRLGFPFPEFTNFEHDTASDEIQWTGQGRTDTPRFPIEGMVTRHVSDSAGQIIGFEMSTPGLRGQSGGPAFDVQGRVWGLQASTAHLDLDFDIDQEVRRSGSKKRVADSAFLHVGHCVHVEVLKDFMRTHGVAFNEG